MEKVCGLRESQLLPISTGLYLDGALPQLAEAVHFLLLNHHLGTLVTWSAVSDGCQLCHPSLRKELPPRQ